MNKPAPLPVRTRTLLVEVSAHTLFIPRVKMLGPAPQLALAVRKLTLVAVWALTSLEPLIAHFGLVVTATV